MTTTSSLCSDIISLTGFMGCGKSSVGRELAALLSCSFIDLDGYIEERSGHRIPEIFSSEGEAAFRNMELSALSSIVWSMPLSGHPAPDAGSHQQPRSPQIVLSLGGGTVTTPECARIVAKHTVCFYLRATTDTLVRNLENDFANRPMLQSTPESAVPPASGNKEKSASDTAHPPSGQYPGHPRPELEPENGHPALDAGSHQQLRTRIEELMRKRSAIYESTAHHIIDTDGKSCRKIAQEILSCLA